MTQRTRVLVGDVLDRLRELPDASVHCCVTSPPYWGLRDYGTEGQIGLEPTVEDWVAKMVEVFREVRRVLRDDGTLWLNLGDNFSDAEMAERRIRDADPMADQPLTEGRTQRSLWGAPP